MASIDGGFNCAYDRTLLVGVPRAAIAIYLYYYTRGGGDSPAGLGRNYRIRRLLHVRLRLRGRHSTGILFARSPIPYSAASHALFSRYYIFSLQNGGGIQQLLASPLALPALLPLHGLSGHSKGQSKRQRRYVCELCRLWEGEEDRGGRCLHA